MSINIGRGTLRRFLVGALPEAERASIEQALLADDGIYEQLLETEEELLDACASGRLPHAEEASFLRYVSHLPDRKRELAVTRALVEGDGRAVAGGTHEPSVRKPMPLRALTIAAALLVTVGASLAALHVAGLMEELDAARPERAGPRGTASPSPPVFVLGPGTFRGRGGAATVIHLSDALWIELRLDLPSDDYTAYRAVVRDADGNEILSQSRLGARSTPSAIHLPLGVPSSAFRPGDYFVVVSGMPPEGASEPLARYDFRVR